MFSLDKFQKEMKSISQKACIDIIPKLHRMEFDEDPRIFCKAVRVTLISLGYDESFIEGEFREKLEKYYDVDTTHIFV